MKHEVYDLVKRSRINVILKPIGRKGNARIKFRILGLANVGIVRRISVLFGNGKIPSSARTRFKFLTLSRLHFERLRTFFSLALLGPFLNTATNFIFIRRMYEIFHALATQLKLKSRISKKPTNLATFPSFDIKASN